MLEFVKNHPIISFCVGYYAVVCFIKSTVDVLHTKQDQPTIIVLNSKDFTDKKESDKE